MNITSGLSHPDDLYLIHIYLIFLYIKLSKHLNDDQWKQDAPELNSKVWGHLTPVSTSTVKKRLRDAGLLGRVVKASFIASLVRTTVFSDRDEG